MKAEEVGKKARELASLEMLWEKEPGRVESMQRVTLSKGRKAVREPSRTRITRLGFKLNFKKSSGRDPKE